MRSVLRPRREMPRAKDAKPTPVAIPPCARFSGPLDLYWRPTSFFSENNPIYRNVLVALDGGRRIKITLFESDALELYGFLSLFQDLRFIYGRKTAHP
jgi:hypothetical protein